MMKIILLFHSAIAVALWDGCYSQLYDPWSDWSDCSTTCGAGVRERKRECSDGRCVQRQTKGCLENDCDDTSMANEFEEWQNWSRCTQTCGEGTEERQRACKRSECIQKETRVCRLRICPGDESIDWSKWSKCSTTCDEGIVMRKRQCKVGNCEQIQKKTCFLKSCTNSAEGLGPWNGWSLCSVTCGTGVRRRIRESILGSRQEIETQSCATKLCEALKFGEWSEWQKCSTTCGPGTRSRRRACIVGSCEQSQTSSCKSIDCPGALSPEYGEWKEWSSCSVTCGTGEQRRIRRCAIGQCQQIMRKTCFAPTCEGTDRFQTWSTWSICSVSCGGGERYRTRQCKPPGNCIQTQGQSCGLSTCLSVRDYSSFTEWSAWSQCSASCGDGEAKRSRQNISGAKAEEQLKYCNIRKCTSGHKYQSWNSWSGCSVTCGSGIKTRIRLCKEGVCQDTQTMQCSLKDCTPIILRYSQWQNWSECSASCGFGVRSRKRFCHDRDCEQSSSQTCRVRACPSDYTEWEEWSPCSVTCGSGISSRKRFCTVGTCEQKQRTVCGMPECKTLWEDWTDWQGCHKSCGGGFDYRRRRCLAPLPSEKCPGDDYDYRRCNTHSCMNGSWSEWNNWSDCSKTCGNGVMTRTRTCESESCNGRNEEIKPCNSVMCVKAFWSSWSTWSECSKTCGDGERARSRICVNGNQWEDGCLGSTLSKEICRSNPCFLVNWSKWSDWRPCSVTCGKGTTNRERVCIGGKPGDPGCNGASAMTVKCEQSACEAPKTSAWDLWTEWTPCPVTCGVGTQSRSRYCSEPNGCNGSSEEAKECDIPDCLHSIIDAEWSTWEKWTNCTVRCGGGRRSRRRECMGGKVGSAGCRGRRIQHKRCNQKKCEWSSWGDFDECSVTCGNGTKRRERKCYNGKMDSDNCDGASWEISLCDKSPCGQATDNSRSRTSSGVKCPDILSPDNAVMAKPTYFKPGARAAFACDPDYETKGDVLMTCLDNGRWSAPIPHCAVKLARCEKNVSSEKCSERCNDDDGCSDAETKCVCDKQCGKICVNLVQECDELRSPENGYIVGTVRTYGYTVTYACNTGYTLQGQSTRLCGANGVWSGDAPRCMQA